MSVPKVRMDPQEKSPKVRNPTWKSLMDFRAAKAIQPLPY